MPGRAEQTDPPAEAGQADGLAPAPALPPIPTRGWLATIGSERLILVLAIGVLIGSATLIALTESGLLALGALALLAFLLMGVWIARDTF